MKAIREVNGYRLIYKPDHPKAMKTENWDGYVYEHMVIVEDHLGRPLLPTEVTHHLDGNRQNNRWENLLVIDRGQHLKLHGWLQAGAPGLETLRRIGANSTKAKEREPLFCKTCGTILQGKQRKTCSQKCAGISLRRVLRPSKEELEAALATKSYLELGRHFGVSNNAVKKWAKQYGLSKPTLSQAKGTPLEGAETSGEV